jgi:hypothetical protein
MATEETVRSNDQQQTITGAKLVTILSGYIDALTSLDSERLKGYVSSYAMNRMTVIRYGMVWDAQSAFRWFERSHELYGNDKVARLLDGLDTFTTDFAESVLEACHYMKSDPTCLYSVCQLRTTSEPLFVALIYDEVEEKCWKILAFFSTPFSGFMDSQSLWHTSVEAAYSAYNTSKTSGLADDESQPSEYKYKDGESEDDDDDYWDQYDKAMDEDEENDDNDVSIKQEVHDGDEEEARNTNDDDYYSRYDAVETVIGEDDDNNDAQQQTTNNAMTEHIQQSIHSLHNLAKANGMSSVDFHKTIFQVLGSLD